MKICNVPPEGWHCTRDAGHEGPCAAWPTNAAPVASAEPEGWKLVPVEPTPEMIAAMHFKGDMDIAIGHAQFYADAEVDYAAMLAVAPAAPVAQAAPAPADEAEYLALRLKRVARAAGRPTYESWSNEQVVGCAATILGDIARALETGLAPAPVAAGAAAQEVGDRMADTIEVIAPALPEGTAAMLRRLVAEWRASPAAHPENADEALQTAVNALQFLAMNAVPHNPRAVAKGALEAIKAAQNRATLPPAQAGKDEAGDFLPKRDVADEIVLLSNVMRHHPQLKPVIGREALIMRCVRAALAATPCPTAADTLNAGEGEKKCD